MADDDSVKLQSGDNEVFSVSKEVACQAVTIKEMLEGAMPQCPLACGARAAAAKGEGGRGEGLGGHRRPPHVHAGAHSPRFPAQRLPPLAPHALPPACFERFHGLANALFLGACRHRVRHRDPAAQR